MTAIIAPAVAEAILQLVDASDRSDRALDRIAADHGLMLRELRALIARRPTRVQAMSPPADEKKVCSKCKTARLRSEFYPDPRTGDGLQPDCRACNNTRPHTETRLLRNRARSRAYALLVEAHRDEFEQLYARAYNEAKAEHELLVAKAAQRGHTDAKVARIKRGPKRREETDVTQRLDVARCPTCHSHHDANHVCPNCSIETTPATPRRKDDVDDVAVERAVTGDHTVTLTIAERRQAVRLLHAQGLTDGAIATTLAISDKTSFRIRRELELPPNKPANVHPISSEHGTARGRARQAVS